MKVVKVSLPSKQGRAEKVAAAAVYNVQPELDERLHQQRLVRVLREEWQMYDFQEARPGMALR